MGPQPSVAAVRRAVRGGLAGLPPGALVLAACSGGADSLALAAALAFEAPKLGLRAGGITVDHGLQPDSAHVAGRVTAAMVGLGLDPAVSVTVQVPERDGDGAYQGPEAAARSARYAALDQAAAASGAAAVLLGHTLDDQAETVLLGLARGSGARSLAGMAPQAGLYRRPLLDLRRAQTVAACAALGLQPWDDPHNHDLSFSRVKVRTQLLPLLEQVLGPNAAEALARTAGLLRDDADALDSLAAAEAARLASTGGDAQGWPVEPLAALPAAVRHRILRGAAISAGCPAGALSQRHVLSLDGLVTGWHGQRWADLPGGIRGRRRYGRLLFTAAPRSEDLSGRERHGSRS